VISILLGLTSAITWGAGDFTGGLAARKTGAYRAVFYGEIVGLALLFAVVSFSPQPMPNLQSIALSALAGAFGTVGLMMLYSAMAQGKMSIAAPVSALLAAALPVVVGIFTDGFPGFLTLLGFAFALAAVWCATHDVGTIAIGSLGDNPFPDATPEFFAAFGRALSAGLGVGVELIAPYRGRHKHELIAAHRDLPLGLSLTCIAPRGGRHCGACNKCHERRVAFARAGVSDPTAYAATA